LRCGTGGRVEPRAGSEVRSLGPTGARLVRAPDRAIDPQAEQGARPAPFELGGSLSDGERRGEDRQSGDNDGQPDAHREGHNHPTEPDQRQR
jgi:hypothetical protein